jgi:hypothetical protein
MLKLYKVDGSYTRYWEAWVDQGCIVIHRGTVGSIGETTAVPLAGVRSADQVIERESRSVRAQGFQEIDIGNHRVVIVQYKIRDLGSSEDLEKRHQIEDCLNDCLGWTGNGHCDGGDIGSGEMNVFCLVVDPWAARDAIVRTLGETGLLKGAVVAVRNYDEESYTVLWPHGATEFSLI